MPTKCALDFRHVGDQHGWLIVAPRSGPEVDEFAKFGERVSRNVSDARGHYIAGLGYRGIGNSAKARSEFDQALKLDVNQMWAKYQLTRTATP